MARQRTSAKPTNDAPEPITTQRAYTLRLRPAIDPNDSPEEVKRKTREMQDALWATHEAVNKGAKVFGDWLLTLRGGLCHTLADSMVKGGKGKTDREPTDDERRNRRILLALSWLSVESVPKEDDSFKTFVVAVGNDDCQSVRYEKVKQALAEILEKRGVTSADAASWVKDCESSLSAAIREDAVWVNRSKAFDELCVQLYGLDRPYSQKVIQSFFGSPDEYFALPSQEADDGEGATTSGNDGPEFRTLARQWVSTNFGTGTKSNTHRIIQSLWTLAQADLSYYVGRSKTECLSHLVSLLQADCPDDANLEESLRVAVGWSTGRPSKGRLAVSTLPDRLTRESLETLQTKLKEEAEDKHGNAELREVPVWIARLRSSIETQCGIPFVGARNHIGEFSTMLDHAARRVSIAHSWIKRAEAERQSFAIDARKIDSVREEAKRWLDQYCRERTGETGAIEAYRIRKRATQAWKEVLAKWARPNCQTVEDRIDAARETQDDPEIDNKFGDIHLFEALAEDDAKCVWRFDGKVDSQPLLDYVAATDARAKHHRFKVPAYRHPDPLSHPVFCDFGNSRWDIRFAAHEATTKLADARAKVASKNSSVKKARDKLAKSRTPESLAKAEATLKSAEQELDEACAIEEWLSRDRALSMKLWDGQSLGNGKALVWSCKRLTKDIIFRQDDGRKSTRLVTRADRLGRAAGGATVGDPVEILGVFDDQHWNGRLQAPRSQLDAIAARIGRHGWDPRAIEMRRRMRWLVTFSAKLRAQGPWLDYCRQFGEHAPARPFVSRKGEFAVKHESNDSRSSGSAKLILSRLPGLRILSVDLGHRYAAACAVWEAIDHKTMQAACAAFNHAGPTESDLYLHLASAGSNGKPRTTIYRRIGADTLPNGDVHPAPWARLDRQFLVKLPGEDRSARAASVREQTLVADFATRLGVADDEDSDKGRQVDELMSRAIRIATLGLKRHARRAKIAYALDPSTTSIAGVGGSEKQFQSGDEDHVDFLTNTLVDWHALASDAKWNDEAARQLWNATIATPKNGLRIEPPRSAATSPDERSRQLRRKLEDELRERLRPAASDLARADRSELHQMWSERWHAEDCSGWHGDLRWLTDWITGRRLVGVKDEGWRRHVGGLSLKRIATLKSLYQLHKAYAMRARPDKPRGAPEKGETNAGVAQSILKAMERMREQRVKQLASRIAEATLGIGRIKGSLVASGVQRPRQRVDDPCHAVVIENLTNYRPDEIRPRRENRQLMTWSSSKVKKYLSEACQLHGLHLREVPAGYTSRQDSRTGSPGIRCSDVPVQDFMTTPWWRKQVNAARKKISDKGGGTARDRYLIDLDDRYASVSEELWKGQPPLRIPVRGGELFVSANPTSPAAKGLQADLNAAANIGLKALLDPDWPGKWWYVPCESATFKPHPDKTKGSAAIAVETPLIRVVSSTSVSTDPEAEGVRKRRTKSPKNKREIVNVWRDPSNSPVSAEGLVWRHFQEYWNVVQAAVIRVLLGSATDVARRDSQP